MKMLTAALAVMIGMGLTVSAIAGEDPAAACKKQAQEKKLAGADADKFVKECVEKAGKK